MTTTKEALEKARDALRNSGEASGSARTRAALNAIEAALLPAPPAPADDVAALMAENERLRAALERIANAPPSPHPHHSTNVVMRSVTVDVARAALNKGGENA